MTTASSAAALTRERLWELYPDLPDAERAALTRELDEIRVRGYALNIDGTEQGVSAIGAAVRDGRGSAVAGLSIAVPSTRFGGDQVEVFAGELRRAVAEVEQALADFPD
ncbi:IclR family transcriptional regulator C-terminal domain-containing protein [Nonomuraea sp. NPDC052129]|uniref:IclR family transcriptional regulator domain-containing protein n=1 Tax=Nonomuraea sp. NPDC052129 TaxID=3154651 RepID=UPI00343CF4D8